MELTEAGFFEQMANISKAHGYDILAEQNGKLKAVIRELIEIGELADLTFIEEQQTEEFKAILNKAKILSL